MEPETAFWILSSAAQAAAALAGLSALLLVFILRETKRELDEDEDLTWSYNKLAERVPFFRLLSVGTVLYLTAVLVSLTSLGLVAPGLPVGAEVDAIIFFVLLLLGIGSITLVAFVWRPVRWADSSA